MDRDECCQRLNESIEMIKSGINRGLLQEVWDSVVYYQVMANSALKSGLTKEELDRYNQKVSDLTNNPGVNSLPLVFERL